ncbi:hypothetical protein [Fibrobacter intestinalis]|uniref:DUF4190 domain-containing protein n=1 Tax=Fibrobacter intestinalis TaxID=28122 RepID=A0A1T4RIR4_9BACT|nr:MULTISPECIES: hypothetical protein [Fibrobacter]PBC74518.1 hypothetical protein BGW94_2179 [Fibrobacter sp. NR9]SKA15884.1 hypothetical protein SAMN02745108_02738 [Fibrobacter intestinalis]
MAVASLVLSILALILAFSLVYGWLGLILGILAIIFAVLGKKSLENQNKSTGVATAGLVMGIIATAICGITWGYCVICAATTAGTAGAAASALGSIL